MFRTIFRTSRSLARRQINSITPVMRHYEFAKLLKSSSDFATCRILSTSTDNTQSLDIIEPTVFEEICSETLESLCDYFEELVEASPNLKGADVQYSDGVLTVFLGSKYGTYVINRQTPNKQIWLSSPFSGPKRYDLVLKDGGYWIYKHDGVSLHTLLQNEMSEIVENQVEFKKCAHSLV